MSKYELQKIFDNTPAESYKEKVKQIDNIKTIEVEWDYDGDDIEVYGFGIDGNTIREYNDLPQNRGWTNKDETLVSSLLMWGELNVE